MFFTLVDCGAILHYPSPWIGVGPSCLAGLHSQLRGHVKMCCSCVTLLYFSIFLLVVVGTQVALTHVRYLHDICHDMGCRQPLTHDRYLHYSCHGMRLQQPHLIRWVSSI